MCEACNRLEMRRDGLELRKKVGEVIVADHNVPSEECEVEIATSSRW